MKHGLTTTIYLALIPLALLVACKRSNTTPRKNNEENTSRVTNTNVKPTYQMYYASSGYAYTLPDSINGVPIAFFLSHPQVDTLAKLLYLSVLKPTDNDTTTRLLALANTPNDTFRPFYRWCLDFVIQLSDGALGEYPGEPALLYALTFPHEFFMFMDTDSSGWRYKKWIELMGYSGFNNQPLDEEKRKKYMYSTALKNCNGCDNVIKKRIQQLADDVLKASRLAD